MCNKKFATHCIRLQIFDFFCKTIKIFYNCLQYQAGMTNLNDATAGIYPIY